MDGIKKKMKTKILGLVGIVVVLCSVFLVVLPAIAADQTTQKASATTLEEDFTLGIYGNANEDDTIDMRDTTYIKLVIFGKKPKTDLADANYDGKVSMLDVGQTKLIILGREKKLTFIDLFGEVETVNKPIKQLVNLGYNGVEMTRALGAVDIIVAVGYDRSKEPRFFPKISKLPAVGAFSPKIDYESILSLEPDAVQTNFEARWALVGDYPAKKKELEEKLPGIPLISLNMREPDEFVKTARTNGYIIDRENEAEELIEWFERYNSILKTRTEGLSDDEKPRVYVERAKFKYQGAASGSRYGVALDLAGGKNIVDEMIGPGDPLYGSIIIELDPEWVVEQNPEFLFKVALSGFETDDPSEQAAAIQEILDRPELAMSDAVKNRRVYTVDDKLLSDPGLNIIGPAYMAKLMHPELFEDIDPQAILQEFIDKFGYMDFNVREHGVFVYPS